jgi:hypothetical protein
VLSSRHENPVLQPCFSITRSIAQESHSYVTLDCFERLLTTGRISGETGRTSGLLTTFVAQTGSSVHWVRGLDSNSSKEFELGLLGLLEVAQQCLNVQKLAKTDAHRELILWEKSIVAVARTFSSLTDLALYHIPLSDGALGIALQQCAGLEKLSIWAYTQAITEAIALPTLRSLTINSVHMTDAVMIAIGQ